MTDRTSLDEALDAMDAFCERAEKAEALVERYREALTPSGETKATYIGEFVTPFRLVDEDGEEEMVPVTVSWTAIKTIMKAIRERAESGGGR